MPMQPKPIAETSMPLLPRIRVFMPEPSPFDFQCLNSAESCNRSVRGSLVILQFAPRRFLGAPPISSVARLLLLHLLVTAAHIAEYQPMACRFAATCSAI